MQIDLISVGQKTWKVFPWFMCVVIASMLFQECEQNSVLANNLSTEKSSVKYYKNKLGGVTASNEVLRYEKKFLKQMVIDKDDSLKKLASEFSKVKTITKWKTHLIIDSINVPFEVKVPCDFTRKGKKENQWYSFDYKVNQNGIQVDSLKIPNETFSITGVKRKWFWGRETITTDITHSNPNIVTEDLKSYEYVEKKKWYNTTLFKVTIGAVAGFLIAK